MSSAHDFLAANYRDSRLAHYYDLEYGGYADDLLFYVQYASALDPVKSAPVLELGCGTGRVTLALAEAGFRVVGLDSSEGMLEVCRQRAMSRGLAERIVPVRGDMRQLEGLPPGRYGLAYCALNTFAYLTTTADQLAMLNSLHGLMLARGTLVLDLTPPWPHLLPPGEGEVVHQGTYPDSDGAVVHKLVTGRAEPSTQTHHVTLIYDHEAEDGTLTRTSHEVVLRWTGRYEMELLLKGTGWSLQAVYGSYELDQFGDESERMIFVARA
ncbi:MAG: class I SAM-dependent methyltransferase [Chloroflexia bacterium]